MWLFQKLCLTLVVLSGGFHPFLLRGQPELVRKHGSDRNKRFWQGSLKALFSGDELYWSSDLSYCAKVTNGQYINVFIEDDSQLLKNISP